MPSLDLMAILNVKGKEQPAEQNDIVDTHLIDGQNALKVEQHEEIPDADYHPYDLEARRQGWLVLLSNEMYNAQAWKNTEVFIMRTENDTWEAWRETWKEGAPNPTSISSKQIAKGVPFQVALKQATGYISVLTKRR